ncbi:MAG: hypothetical protein ABS52_03350 [Gemmatimonadetes bacterium SCN 70-22]|nr:MAG: hypothetical protein ABS52_03350 [Gemmatimonadetes bacterium SCN 70-22]
MHDHAAGADHPGGEGHDGHPAERAPGHLPRQAAPPELRPDTAARRDVGVIIVAAGSGSRTGSRELKQFRWVAGKPMLLHSIQAFHRRADVAQVVAVLPRSVAGDPPPWIFQCDVDRLLVSVGGRERMDSVWSGIEDLDDEVEIVVVHDAARPLVTDATIDAVIRQARAGTGAIAALPVVCEPSIAPASGARRRPRPFPGRCSSARTSRRAAREWGQRTMPPSASDSPSRSSWCGGVSVP